MRPIPRKPDGGSDPEVLEKIHAIANSYCQVFSTCGLCLFALSRGTELPLVEFINAFSGWDFSVAEALKVGRRALTLRQSFNIREGLTPEQFTLPEMISQPPAMGSFSGFLIDFNGLREHFYRAMDWEADKVVPSAKCLSELGLKDLMA